VGLAGPVTSVEEMLLVTDIGSRYVAALAGKNTDTLLGLFAQDVVFRALTPGRFWGASSPQAVVHEVLYHWFEPADVIESVDHVQVGSIVDRERVDYRLRVRHPDGVFAVEQRAYFDTDSAGLICRMQVMCAGFRPHEENTGSGVRTVSRSVGLS
jgi:hypothetical protein